jgi:hypothetical protein
MSQCDNETAKQPSCVANFRNVLEDNHVPGKGRYHNVLVEDSANTKFYFYDACGVFVELLTAEGGGGGDPLVLSVNGETGHVVLDYEDVGAVGIDTIFINVKDHGAIGNNTADDTAAIQSAIDIAAAGGGVVWFPIGTYKISARLEVDDGVTLLGAARGTSGTGENTDMGVIIRQITPAEDGIYSINSSGTRLQNIVVLGPGSGVGRGINYDWSDTIPFFHHFESVTVRNFGNTGVRMRTACVSNFINVFSSENGNHGFEWPEGGTSCHFSSCFARSNAKAGFYWLNSVYHNLSACAADFNGVSYEIVDAQSIGFFGCGSEFPALNGAPYEGTSWRIDNSAKVGLYSCWVTGNDNIAIEVINTAQSAWLDVVDNSPEAGAVYFIQTEAGTMVNIPHMYNSSPNDLAAGTAHILNDGGGSIKPIADLIMNNNQGIYFRDFADTDDKLTLFVGVDDITGLRSAGGGLQLKREDNVALLWIEEASDAVWILGDLMLTNNKSLVWRDAADTDDKVVLHLGTLDNVVLRGAGGDIFLEAEDTSVLARFLEDGTGMILPGSSGDIQISAAPDSSEYNFSVNATGVLSLFGSAGATLGLRLFDGKFWITNPETPASAAAAGEAGQIAWDANFVYVCVATNTWKRVAIATW